MKQRSTFSEIGQILKIAEKSEKHLIIVLISAALAEAITPYAAYITAMLLLDQLSQHQTAGIPLIIACGLSAEIILLLINHLFKSLISYKVQSIETGVRHQIADKAMSISYETLESNRYQELSRNIEQSDMWAGGISQIIAETNKFTGAVLGIFVAVISLVVMLINGSSAAYDLKLSYWSFPVIFVAMIFILNFAIGSKLQKKNTDKIVALFQKIQEANGGGMMFIQLMSDYHLGKDLRLYELQDMVSQQIELIRTDPEGISLYRKMSQLKGKIPCLMAVINAVILALAYACAGYFAYHGIISLGSVMVYAGALYEISQAASTLNVSYGNLSESGRMYEPYRKLLQLPEDDPEQNSKQVEDAFRSLEFREVSFTYPGSTQPVLERVSFTIHQGEHIALVGLNGSGKTSLVKLLCGLYTPDHGQILYNDQDIRKLSRESYRKMLGTVFQDFKLFSFKLGENVAAFGVLDPEVAEKCLAMAGFTSGDKLLDLDQYLYRDYEDGGIEISGGEAQKIALARAFYKNAQLLILDEPTSALDPKTEADFYERIMDMDDSDTHTLIFVSHRLSSCSRCDRILVLDNRKVVQDGSHEELLKNEQGRYFELWTAQKGIYQ